MHDSNCDCDCKDGSCDDHGSHGNKCECCCDDDKMSKEHLQAKKKRLEEKLKWVNEKLKKAK